MKKFFIILFSFILTAGLAGSALAYVNESWEWHKVDGKAKRTLHYCVSTAIEYTSKDRVLEIEKAEAGMPDSWNSWLKEAVDNWNKAESGWKLEPVEFKIPPCQVVIVLADFDETTTGGGFAQIMDTDKDGKIDLTIIAMDQNLEDTLKNLPEDQDTADSNRDGWSTDDKEMTRDPVGVLKHEFSHAMRMDHHPDADHQAATDPDITDPRKAGDHKKELSDEDKREARTSAIEDAIFPNFRPCFQKNNFEYQGIEISFDDNSFANENSMPFLKFSGVAIPGPITLEGGYSHIIDNTAIWFKTELPILKPLSISMPYSDEDLNGGNNKWIGDYHGLVPPALDENTIALFKYIEEPFGVYAEGNSHWEKIEASAYQVDTDNNKVTFQTMEAGTFGLSAMPKAGQVTIDDQLAGISVTSESVNKKLLIYVLGGLVVLAGLGGLVYLSKPLLKKKK